MLHKLDHKANNNILQMNLKKWISFSTNYTRRIAYPAGTGKIIFQLFKG